MKLSALYDQLKPDANGIPKIILDPLFSIKHWSARGLKMTLELAALLPIGALNALMNRHRGQTQLSKTILQMFALVFFTETIQLFIMSRRSDMTSLVVAVLAGMISHLIIQKWTKTNDREQAHQRWTDALILVLGYALLLCVFTWSPFKFEFDLKTVLNKIRYETNPIPFRHHFSARSLASAVDIVKETTLYIPLGLFVRRLFNLVKNVTAKKASCWALILGSGFALTMEISQAICIGRFIDMTDVLLATFGCLIGSTLAAVLTLKRNRHSRTKSHL